MKIIALLLGCGCLLLVYDLYFGRNGIQQYKEVAMQLEVAQKQSLVLQKRNQEVEDQISDLRQGSVAIEELARSELGLIKPNERFFRVLASEKQMRTDTTIRLN